MSTPELPIELWLRIFREAYCCQGGLELGIGVPLALMAISATWCRQLAQEHLPAMLRRWLTFSVLQHGNGLFKDPDGWREQIKRASAGDAEECRAVITGKVEPRDYGNNACAMHRALQPGPSCWPSLAFYRNVARLNAVDRVTRQCAGDHYSSKVVRPIPDFGVNLCRIYMLQSVADPRPHTRLLSVANYAHLLQRPGISSDPPADGQTDIKIVAWRIQSDRWPRMEYRLASMPLVHMCRTPRLRRAPLVYDESYRAPDVNGIERTLIYSEAPVDDIVYYLSNREAMERVTEAALDGISAELIQVGTSQ